MRNKNNVPTIEEKKNKRWKAEETKFPNIHKNTLQMFYEVGNAQDMFVRPKQSTFFQGTLNKANNVKFIGLQYSTDSTGMDVPKTADSNS